jgi:hypothetical protein
MYSINGFKWKLDLRLLAEMNRKTSSSQDLYWETFYASETNAYIQFFMGTGLWVKTR